MGAAQVMSIAGNEGTSRADVSLGTRRGREASSAAPIRSPSRGSSRFGRLRLLEQEGCARGHGPSDSSFGGDSELDGALIAAFGEMVRAQRGEAAASLSERLSESGVDSIVCAFLEDDLREAADALADAEAYFQETLEALDQRRPSPKMLMERAADVGILERVDYLHQILSNMRRRLVQVAAGLR